MNRRFFLRSTAAGSAAAIGHASGQTPGKAALPQRRLGKTGERVPLLGLGTGPGGMGLPDADAVALYHAAIDAGVTFLDTSPNYGRAHAQLREVLRERRDEVLVATKTLTSRKNEALSILEKCLAGLGVEYVDITYIHSMGDQDVDTVLSAGGSLAGLREAQRRGWTRYVGFTAHNRPWKSAKVLRETEVDVVMLALNFADRHTYAFEDEVAPLARRQDAGVIAMKVFGGAPSMNYKTPARSHLAAHGSHDHEAALRYALHLEGTAMAVVGMFTQDELRQDLAWARRSEPLLPAEKERLARAGRTIAADWGPHFGPVS